MLPRTRVVLDTGNAVRAFNRTIKRHNGLRPTNTKEVLARIVAVLNLGNFGCVDNLRGMSELYSQELIKVTYRDEKLLADGQLLSNAVVTLGLVVRDQMHATGIIGEFSGYGYLYNDLLGDDLVVIRLPQFETSDGNTINGVPVHPSVD